MNENLVKAPAPELTIAEKWVHYKNAESEVKKAIDELKATALDQVSSAGGFLVGRTGKAQMVNKTERKAKESLKTFLAEEGILEMCTKDDIDLKKVQDMVEAGVLDKEAVEAHIITKENPYLKLGK